MIVPRGPQQRALLLFRPLRPATCDYPARPAACRGGCSIRPRLSLRPIPLPRVVAGLCAPVDRALFIVRFPCRDCSCFPCRDCGRSRCRFPCLRSVANSAGYLPQLLGQTRRGSRWQGWLCRRRRRGLGFGVDLRGLMGQLPLRSPGLQRSGSSCRRDCGLGRRRHAAFLFGSNHKAPCVFIRMFAWHEPLPELLP